MGEAGLFGAFEVFAFDGVDFDHLSFEHVERDLDDGAAFEGGRFLAALGVAFEVGRGFDDLEDDGLGDLD